MSIKHINKKNITIFSLIACIWLFFSSVFIVKAFNDSKLYDGLTENAKIDSETTLWKKITSIKNTLQANELIEKEEYEKALPLISGNTADDYYNRATIQTLLAYKRGVQNTISGLENAQIFIAQAQQNFDIAKKLSTSPTITRAIIDNQNTIRGVATVVDIKTCYGIWQNIIIQMNDIASIIENIKNTLNKEEIYINKRAKTLDPKCYKKIADILETSRWQVWLFQLQIQKDTTKYISDFSDKIENPILCIDAPYENILPSMIKGKEWLQQYQQLHQNTIEALKNNNPQDIKELCDQTKNDEQINQQIESSVQELLQKLEDNKTENKKKQRASTEVQYKDFFDKDEKKTLEEIQTTNQWWIDTMLNIRGKGNYDPEQYINDMFNQFYGNSGDFINLHK